MTAQQAWAEQDTERRDKDKRGSSRVLNPCSEKTTGKGERGER